MLVGPELHDAHHALRMLAKYPGIGVEEQSRVTELADRLWNVHCGLVEKRIGTQYRPALWIQITLTALVIVLGVLPLVVIAWAEFA